jgi:hypothetical protein
MDASHIDLRATGAALSEPTSYPEQENEREITDTDELEEQVRRRAYEISQSDEAGTDDENWARAESEIRQQHGQI